MFNWKGKKVLVTGSDGMIGQELVEQLKQLNAIVMTADIKSNYDLRDPISCKALCEGAEIIFHLMGVKGNPKMTMERPVDFMEPMLKCDVNMITHAQQAGVKRFLYTSSIAVENPETDKYPAWAKKTAEVLIEAMKIQYPKGTQYCIVRPANVYGRYDNFEAKELMVISNLIKKALNKKNTQLEVWGNGEQERDFINAKDVARGMIQAIEQMPEYPVNLCSGDGIKIKEIAEIIGKETGKQIIYDISKPTGDARRVMMLNWDFMPEIGIKQGIKEIIEYVKSK